MTIQETLDEFKIGYLESGHHHCRTGWLQIKNCPFCSSQNYHLGWNLAGNFAACWKCGGHSAWSVLLQLGIPRDRIKTVLGATITLPAHDGRERTQISLKEPKGVCPFAPIHARYLKDRGFDPEEISRVWNVAALKHHPRLSWRLYIPIIYQGQKVSWTTRTVGERNPHRYISASSHDEVINHKTLIYGGDFCTHSIVVVEGPTDAWAIGPGAGALFGTAFTSGQLRKLVNVPRRFVCFDSSPDAQRKARDLAKTLSCFPGVTENIEIDAKDPGEASEKEKKLIRKVAGL